ncbi:rRNA processing protein Fcf2 [Schizosaccharomyces japonicus yFS275]|uniref:rRNA processing protein Fcf2 n=1 Tax=Schizosaccharomyces japonicus (strain yFS275 / FY16936) TaxID=402676 RepID=B6K7W4_SCHJY|nr:rRNA processing protein Fcf2 [Schizosaccharomyces japonicus yFS275]EEB09618.1 rRNA processing protein Fcf2 [Schizosaccharomyces japonicus yFS275]
MEGLAVIPQLLREYKLNAQTADENDVINPSNNAVATLPKIIPSTVQLPSYFQYKETPELKQDAIAVEIQSETELQTSFNKNIADGQKKKGIRDTAGSDWFEMPAGELTESVKRDIQLLKMRNVLDPKRHYRRDTSTSLPKYFQMGRIVDGPFDFVSNRYTRAERKETILDEVLNDTERLKKFILCMTMNKYG